MHQIKTTMTLMLFGIFLNGCKENTQRISGFKVHGIDVSHYQKNINWEVIVQQDIKFAFVKATEGKSIADSLFKKNWKGLHKNKIIRGAYHYFHPGTNVLSQYNNFKTQVNLSKGDLPPVIDIEESNGKSKKEIIKAIKKWINLVEKDYDLKPIIYTNFKFYNAYIGGNFDQYPIWIANYTYKDPCLYYGDSWTFWQYGNRGRLEGIEGDVDFNVFNGSILELENLRYDPDQNSQVLE